jgi:hypothetical protein
MQDEIELVSGNTITVGTNNTGKTYTVIQYAEFLASRKVNGVWRQVRPIIVLDHASNHKSFKEFLVVPMELLQYRLNVVENPHLSKVRVCIKKSQIEEFCNYLIHFQRDTVVIFDDIGGYFTGNMTEAKIDFLGTPKNNGNDYIHVFHNWRAPAKKLLSVCSVIIIKQDYEAMGRVDGLPFPQQVEVLQEEIIAENKLRPSGRKFATRILDVMDYKVTVMDFNNQFHTYDGDEYFQGKLKKNKR